MDHAVPDLQLDIDAGGARLVGEHDGIIQHGFAVADLDQQRRQAREVGIERRRQGIAADRPARPR